MNNQNELMHSTGEIEPGDHPLGCLCTGCTTGRLLERSGRYDSHIETYLHHIKDLRSTLEQLKAMPVPRSTGIAGKTASGAAALADSAVRESVPNACKGAA